MIANSDHIKKRDKHATLAVFPIEALVAAIHDLDHVKTELERIETAKQFWLNYHEDNRWIDRNGSRNSLKQTLEAPEVYYEKGQLRIADGRHRILALQQLGYSHVVCEI